MRAIARRFVAYLRLSIMLVSCLVMLATNTRMVTATEPGITQQRQQEDDNKLPLAPGYSEEQSQDSNQDSLLRGANFQSERVSSMKGLIDFILSMKRSGLYNSVKQFQVYTKSSPGPGQPSAIINLLDQDSPESADGKSNPAQLHKLSTIKAKADIKTETQSTSVPKDKENSQNVVNAKALSGAKAKDAAGRIKEKTNFVPASEFVVRKEVVNGQGDANKLIASKQLDKSIEIGPKDEAVGSQVAVAKSVVDIDKLLAKLSQVDKLLARLQAIKQRDAAIATSDARCDDSDWDYGFDLSESELNEPDQEDTAPPHNDTSTLSPVAATNRTSAASVQLRQ